MSLCGKIILKTPFAHCWHLLLTVFFIFFLTVSAGAQTGDTIRVNADTAAVRKLVDSAAQMVMSDSGRTRRLEDSLGIRISKDALSAPVTAKATDSAVLDMKRDIFYLYGDAEVNYEELKLTAGQISFEQSTNTVIAQPSFDSSGAIAKRPTFAQGGETVTYDSLQYNFKSKRALIRNARSQYGEGFVHSLQVKRNPDQSIYGWQNVYTTCSLDTPHFGIRAKKLKIIPNRIIASASANIVIEQVPTPFFLPFGLFPITQRQRSGFQLPSYTIEEARGLGLTNGGYYFHFNDYYDFLLLTNIYTKGSYNLSGISTYASRYRYSGGVSLNYAYNKTGESFEPGATVNRTYAVNWRHQTDPKSRPGVNFNASVNIASGSYYAQNSYNYNEIVQNQLVSSISYSKNWLNKPYALTIGANHNQNLGTGEVNVTFPNINFFINQFNPFENKGRIGTPRWYERISMSYNVNATNKATFNDSSFSFSSLGKDFRNGIKHNIPVTANYNVLRFINVNFNASYNEYWLTERHFLFYNTAEGIVDTIGERGFFAARDFTTSVGLNTRIFGTKFFKRGKLMGIRHEIRPSVTLGYVPDYGAAPFNYYYRTRLDTTDVIRYLSPYESSVIGTPGMGQYGRFASTVGFRLENVLQIKTRSKSDTTGRGRNISLIDGLSFQTSYNIAADSFNWRPFDIDFRTNIVNVISFNARASFDPYARDAYSGRRLPVTVMSQGGGLARFTDASVALSANFRSKENNGKDRQQAAIRTDEYNLLMQNGGYYNYVDFNIPWSLSVNYSLNLSRQFSVFSRSDTLTYNQSLMFGGDFNITPRWKIGYQSGYDFTTKSMSMTNLSLYRDLHCWEMALSAIPFGPRKQFTFTLNVKASVLQDLRLIRRRDFRDVVQD